MKKILYIVICLSFVLCLSACTYNNQPDNDTVNKDSDKIATQEKSLYLINNKYALILDNIVKAYPWNDDDLTIVPENPELSYMYRQSSELSDIGFALIDLDGNGYDELIISDPSKFVYDVYTISNGKVVHLFESGERYCYILRENGLIENSWLSSAATSGHDFYRFNDGKLDFIERITLDAYHALDIGIIKEITEASEDNCFFISITDQTEDYRSATLDEALGKIESYQNANKELEIEYTLLSDYMN